MSWDPTDSDIEVKFTELLGKETELRTQIRQIRTYQQNINNVKLVPSLEIIEGVIIFSPPPDYAGNPMDDNYRIGQKAELIEKITEFLDI